MLPDISCGVFAPIMRLFANSTLFPSTTLFRSANGTNASCFCAHSEPSVGRSADRKSTRLNSSHPSTSYAAFCSKKKIWSALDPNLLYYHSQGNDKLLKAYNPATGASALVKDFS